MIDQPKTCGQCQAELAADSLSALCPQCLLQIGFDTQPQQNSDQNHSHVDQPTFVAPTGEELAPHFPQLEILEVLGHGGMGVVYKARQIELDRLVALKILRSNISHDSGFAERFLREARAFAKLNHPNIITVYDFGRKGTLFFFIMEFVDGANLRHVERVGQLSPAEALNIVPQVCSALQYAHDNGVVHRDIKPENILITRPGEVRIADFGLAKLAGHKDDAPLTGTWQVMGTPHYMAPEQIEQPTTVDHRADIYSLGVVIYELLTGELPIGRFRLPSEKVQVDVRLDEVVLRSLDKEPDRRYQRVTDVATAVEEASVDRTTAKPTLRSAAAWSAKQALHTVEQVTQFAANGAKNVQKQTRQITANRYGLGTKLMWISLIDIAISVWFLADPPRNYPTELTCWASIAASCVTFWLGRQYRLQNVSGPMWLLAVASLPWFSLFFLFSLLRAGITVLMLLEKIRNINARPEASETATEETLAADAFKLDVFERCISATQRFLKRFTLRRVFFSAFGIIGWCGLCFSVADVVFSTRILHSAESPDVAQLNVSATSGDAEDIPPTAPPQTLRRKTIPTQPPVGFAILAVGIWFLGLVRVLRILYQLLWRTVAPGESMEAVERSARRQWNGSCAAFLFWIPISAFATYTLLASYGLLTLKQPIHGRPLPFPLYASTFEAALMTSITFAAIVLLCTLMARPLLRSIGWHAGAVAATIAILLPPLSVFAFPTGLAAWIQLTDRSTQRLFANVSDVPDA